MLRLVIVAALTAPLLAVAACSTSTPVEGRYETDLARLDASCRERSGILQPTGAVTGRPEADNACVIRGGAVRAGNS